MKIISVTSLVFSEIKVIRFGRFCDQRGYFTEPYRKSDIQNHPDLSSLKNTSFLQCNESRSRPGVLRGMHFQWNPYMGKMVRTMDGHMLDLILDIRKGAPTFGKIIAYDMPSAPRGDCEEWIWVPPGFAHGNIFIEDTRIEYFCTGEYSQGCESCISPLANDIDWSLCDPRLKKTFDDLVGGALIITDKDKNGLSLRSWEADKRSDNFLFKNC